MGTRNMKTINVYYNDDPKNAAEGELLKVIPDEMYAARVSMPATRQRTAQKDGILLTKDEIRAMIRALQKVL